MMRNRSRLGALVIASVVKLTPDGEAVLKLGEYGVFGNEPGTSMGPPGSPSSPTAASWSRTATGTPDWCGSMPTATI